MTRARIVKRVKAIYIEFKVLISSIVFVSECFGHELLWGDGLNSLSKALGLLLLLHAARMPC